MTDTILMPVVVALLAACWVALMLINGNVLKILAELKKRNYIQDLTNAVMQTTQTQNPSSPTKTTQLYATNNPQDESEPPSSTL